MLFRNSEIYLYKCGGHQGNPWGALVPDLPRTLVVVACHD